MLSASVPLHAVGELGQEGAGLLSAASAAVEVGAGAGHLLRGVRDGQGDADGSPPCSPVALRTAALMLIMCLPPITPTVFRYSYR